MNGSPKLVEYVGIPGYPGIPLPRVIGIARLGQENARVAPIRYLRGNALDPRGDENKIICQMVNDRAQRWGGGIARSCSKKFPLAQAEFSKWIAKLPPHDRLGAVHFSNEKDGVVIASLVAQEGYGKSEFPRIRYASLEKCLDDVAIMAKSIDATIHMPRIGAGAAGGEWSIIEEIIEERLVAQGVKVTVYDLPPRRAQLNLFE